MKTPNTVAILMATIQEMAHRERIVLKCNAVTDAEFQDSVSMEIYTTIQYERVDKRKVHRINFVDSIGKAIPSSNVFNKFSTNLEEAFVIEQIFNKVNEELVEDVAEVVAETPAEILSTVATQEIPEAKVTKQSKKKMLLK
jgi:hypothetical protein